LFAIPGRFLARFILSATRDTRGLAAAAVVRDHTIRIMSWAALLCAGLLALFAQIRFMRPLRQIMVAVDCITAAAYDTRLEASRTDEFGVLAASFNLMARVSKKGAPSVSMSRRAFCGQSPTGRPAKLPDKENYVILR